MIEYEYCLDTCSLYVQIDTYKRRKKIGMDGDGYRGKDTRPHTPYFILYINLCPNFFKFLRETSLVFELLLFISITYRTIGLPLPSKKDCEKNMARGDHRVVFSGQSCMVQWKDNKAVYLPSHCFAVEPMQNVTRYHATEKGHKQVPCPRLVTEYNKHMGGVDLLDSREKNYAITVRVKKWYWAACTWFLTVSMVQAWRLSRIHKKQEHQLAREEDNREMEAWEERMAEREERGEEDRRRQKAKVDSEMLSRDKINSEKNRERKKIKEIPLLDFIRQVVESIVVANSTTSQTRCPRAWCEPGSLSPTWK